MTMTVVETPSSDSNATKSIHVNSKVSLESALFFTKMSVYFAWTWPLSNSASRWEVTKYNIAWALSFVNVLSLIPPLFTAIQVYQSNSVIVTQTACFLCGGFNYLIKTLIYRVRRKQMQILVNEMEDFIKYPQAHEKMILQYYVDRCWVLHVIITLLNYLAAIVMICGPLVFPQPLPTNAVYPFPVDLGFGKYLAYIHQTVVGVQISACLTTDCQIGLMMWYAGAKLEILADEFKDVLGLKEFPSFVQKHERLLSYADEVSDTMSYIAFVTSVSCTISTVMSVMQLVSNETLGIKVQYVPMIIVSVMNLFICAWPAENLLQACDLMATAVYNSPWVDMSPKMMKNLRFVLQRCQRPVEVSISGFLPTLSLHFYASFLSTAFSYFTTLRAVVTVNPKD